MPLIDTSYFERSIAVAQRGEEVQKELLESYIDALEPEFLEAVLGSFGATVVLPSNDAVSRMLTLRGFLKYAFARYVFYYHLRDSNETPTTSGKGAGKHANASRTSPDRNMCIAWNEMIAKLRKMYAYIRSSELYPEFVESDVTPFEYQNTWGI